MITFEYKKGDMLKKMDNGSIFVHAVNGKGRWGSGIAKSLHTKFVGAYAQYASKVNKVGMGYIVEDKGFKIGCLVTSKGYGAYKDSPKQITVATYKAVKSLLESITDETITIESPKINSGLFETPWQWTKKAITKACNESTKTIKWVVWEL